MLLCGFLLAANRQPHHDVHRRRGRGSWRPNIGISPARSFFQNVLPSGHVVEEAPGGGLLVFGEAQVKRVGKRGVLVVGLSSGPQPFGRGIPGRPPDFADSSGRREICMPGWPSRAMRLPPGRLTFMVGVISQPGAHSTGFFFFFLSTVCSAAWPSGGSCLLPDVFTRGAFGSATVAALDVDVKDPAAFGGTTPRGCVRVTPGPTSTMASGMGLSGRAEELVSLRCKRFSAAPQPGAGGRPLPGSPPRGLRPWCVQHQRICASVKPSRQIRGARKEGSRGPAGS